MPTRSAGLLPFRLTSDGTLELFLVHPGGPYWARKDKCSWSIAKGEYGDGEAALAAAEREFTEEIGCSPPSGRRIDLGQVRQTGGKVVRAWAIEAAQFTVTEVASNEFELEWPPHSGRYQSFPEVDRAEWMSTAVARWRLVRAQLAFVDRLEESVQIHPETPPADGP